MSAAEIIEATTLPELLAGAGAPAPEILAAARALAPWPLFPEQAAILSESAILHERQSAIVCGPPGSGKTVIADAAALATLQRAHIVFYLVPTRSLARERADALSAALGPRGFSVAATSRDDRAADHRIEAGCIDIVVAVYEKARHLFLNNPGIRQATGLIIADEVQLLDDPERGAGAEMLLRLWLAQPQRPQLLGLGSGPAAEAVASRLAVPCHRIARRAETLVEATISLSTGEVFARDAQTGRQLDKPPLRLSSNSFDETELLPHILEQLPKPCLVLCPTRKSAWLHAREVADRILAKPQVLEHWQQAGAHLADLLHKRIAIHTTDLVREERQHVERLFREARIDFCFSTTTLAEGVNLLARSVVVLEPALFGAHQLRNLIGRAGRPGAGPGIAVLLAANPGEAASLQRILGDRATPTPPPVDRLQASLECLAISVACSNLQCYESIPDLLPRRQIVAHAIRSGLLQEGSGEGELSLTQAGHLLCAGGIPAGAIAGWRSIARRFPNGGDHPANCFLALGGSGLCQRMPLDSFERQSGRWVALLGDQLMKDPSPLARYFLDFLWQNASVPRHLHQAAKAVMLLLRHAAGERCETLMQDFAISPGWIEEIVQNSRYVVSQAMRLLAAAVPELPERPPELPTRERITIEEPEPLLVIHRGTTGTVSLNGTEVYLTRLQFRMLEFLALHAGDGIPYERLERYLWPDAIVERQQIGFHRRRLEERLSAACGHHAPLIETHPTWGLRLLLRRDQVRFEERPELPLALHQSHSGVNSVARARIVQI